MSLIAAVTHDEKQYMGYDGLATNSLGGRDEIGNRKAVCMLDVDGLPWLIGSAGEVKGLQIIESSMKLPGKAPERESNLVVYLTKNFSPQLRESLDNQGALLKGRNGRVRLPFDLLLGISGKLCIMNQDFEIFILDRTYAAIGTGSDTALGVLGSTEDLIPDPTSRIALALEITARHCSSVGGRGRIVTSDGEEIPIKKIRSQRKT